LPFLKTLRLGNPWILKRLARAFSSVASTLASLADSPLSAVAALAYSGAKFLQCPHQGA